MKINYPTKCNATTYQHLLCEGITMFSEPVVPDDLDNNEEKPSRPLMLGRWLWKDPNIAALEPDYKTATVKFHKINNAMLYGEENVECKNTN